MKWIAQNLQWLALSLVLILGLSLRLPNLNESLWNDEIWSTRVLLGSPAALYQTAINDLHPPFYQALMYGWIRVFGDSELSVRMPSLLFGLASILLTFAVSVIVLDRKTALLASFFMAASPTHIWYSQEARSYSALLFFLLLSLLAYLKLKSPAPSRLWFWVYFGAMFSAVLSHYFMGVYALLIAGICLWERHPRRKFLLATNLSSLVGLASWMLFKIARTGSPEGGGYLRGFKLREFWRLFFNWFLYGGVWKEAEYHREIFLAQLLFLALLLYGSVLLLRQKGGASNQGARALPLYLLALPVFLLTVTLAGMKAYIERSVFVALPFFYIAIARGIVGLGEFSYPRRFASFGRILMPTLVGVCVLGAIALNAATLREYYRRDAEYTVYKPNPDWRSAARYFERELSRPGESQTIFAVVPPLEMTYYNPRFRNLWLGLAPDQGVLTGEDARRYWAIYSLGPDPLKYLHDALSRTGANVFYMVNNRFWPGAFLSVFKDVTRDGKFQYQATQSFKGIEIYKFTVRESAAERISISSDERTERREDSR